jgi:SAM-dependent methyltransferase
MVDRFEQLRRHLHKDAVGVEIGPFFNPIAPRRAGYNVVTVDRADMPTLIERATKIAGLPPDMIGNIEHVDIVLADGESFADACLARRPEGYAYLVGSHSLEHIPDLLGFFEEADRLLTPAGVITFAVPDLRYCFDFFKPHSTTGQVLRAHRERRGRHEPETLFDAIALNASRDGAGAWLRDPFAMPRVETDLRHAFDEYNFVFAEAADPHAPYRDAHCWFFTPAVFELIVFDLNVLGCIPFVVTGLEENPGSEFIAHMARGATPADAAAVRERRNQLLHRAMSELAERYPR